MASKTTNRATAWGKAKTARPNSFDGIRIVLPLNKGRHAYVVDPLSRKTQHVAVDSQKFLDVMSAVVAAGRAEALRSELQEMGWDTQLAALETAGVFNTPVVEE